MHRELQTRSELILVMFDNVTNFQSNSYAVCTLYINIYFFLLISLTRARQYLNSFLMTF